MQIMYDTVPDSISVPGLTTDQDHQLQSELSTALYRNEPVHPVAATIMDAARRLSDQ